MAIEAISSDAPASAAPPSAGLLKDAPVDALALTMRFLSYAEAMRAGSSCSDLREAYYKNSLIHVTTDVVGGKSVAIDLDIGSAKQVVLLSVIRGGLFGRAELSSIIKAHAADMVVREHFDDWSWAWEALAKTQWPNCDKIFPRHADSGRYDLLYDEKGGQDWFQRLAEAEEPREEVERDILFFHDIKGGDDPMNIVFSLQRLHLTFEMDWGRWGHILANAVAASGIVYLIGKLLPSDENLLRENKGYLAPGTGEAACYVFRHLCENGNSSVISAMVEEGCLRPLVCALGSFSIGDDERILCACCLQTIAGTSVEMSNAVVEASALSVLGSRVLKSFHEIRKNVVWKKQQERILVSSTKCLPLVLSGIRHAQSIHPSLSRSLLMEIVPTLNVLIKNSLPSSIVVTALKSLGIIASMALSTEQGPSAMEATIPAQIIEKIVTRKPLKRVVSFLRSTSIHDVMDNGLNLIYILARNGHAKSVIAAGFLDAVSNILQQDHWFPDELFAALMSKLASNCESTSNEPWKEYGEYLWPGCTSIFVQVPLRELFAGDSWLYNLASQSDMAGSRTWLEKFGCRLKTKNRKQQKIMKSLGKLWQLFQIKGATPEGSALAKGFVAVGGLPQIFRWLQRTDSMNIRTEIATIVFSVVTLSSRDPSFVFEEVVNSNIMSELWSNLVIRSTHMPADTTFWWVVCAGFLARCNQHFRDSIFNSSKNVMDVLLKLVGSDHKPSQTPNTFLPVPMLLNPHSLSLGDLALEEALVNIESIFEESLTCETKISIVKSCLASLVTEPNISDLRFGNLLSRVGRLPLEVNSAIASELLDDGRVMGRIVKSLLSPEMTDSYLLPLLWFNLEGNSKNFDVALEAGLLSVDFNYFLRHPSEFVVRYACLALGKIFVAINSLDHRSRMHLVGYRGVLVDLLSHQEILDFPSSYRTWSKRHSAAGALSSLAIGLVRGPSFDYLVCKAVIGGLISDGVVQSICGSLADFDLVNGEIVGRSADAGYFSSGHFLKAIHGVLWVDTYDQEATAPSDFGIAVASYVKEISSFQQSSSSLSRFWSKRIMLEFFPEETPAPVGDKLRHLVAWVALAYSEHP